jgi:DivIVA domain-containing protein
MVWVLCAVVIVIIGAAVMAASGRFGAVPQVVEDRPAPDLPSHPLGPDDLRAVRFDVVARGYSMAQVDALLARMAVEMQMPAQAPKALADPQVESPERGPEARG